MSIGFKITIEVTPESIEELVTGLEEQELERFMEQLKPNLQVALEVETRQYIQYAIEELTGGDASE